MIKTIIFDFGDVFLTLDKSATLKHMKIHGATELSEELIKVNASYEKGLISSSEFVQLYITCFPKLTQDAFIEAWNSILIEFPAERLEFLKQLQASGKYTLILLSNTNALHIDWVKANIPIYEEFKSCFDQFYLSHEIHYRKPNRDIFEYVLNTNKLSPEETLFVDDTQDHILSAKTLGLHIWHLQAGKEEVVDLFSIKSDLF
ncbi:haloacid dehalogenase-like hydrolase [Psychroflexus torquis ATCC 700755]|uniref:Haloacid dehalogenase-like hydrolase n=1 Tax=Psychroflexus torquis (strain ATCC 700755 / CIP 106069 / ACAM 623) TaxID=313595 RepID=K4IAH0_PSYTT|nr:HAD-IA family hydrolase [Psychroflexus torquis]AFU67607.1 haloacid dehalogenase-like hydrolase [Psychroflexus torquis ATCC 700755]